MSTPDRYPVTDYPSLRICLKTLWKTKLKTRSNLKFKVKIISLILYSVIVFADFRSWIFARVRWSFRIKFQYYHSHTSTSIGHHNVLSLYLLMILYSYILVLSSICIIHFGVVDVYIILYYRGGIEPLYYKLVDGFDLEFRNNSPPPEINVCTCKSFAN